MKPLKQDNNIKMYSTYNERKCIVPGKFIRTLKNKIYRYMTLETKHAYIDKLDDLQQYILQNN